MSKKDGGPAFPCIEATCTGIDSDGFERYETQATGGMTLRQWYAGLAMQAALSSDFGISNSYAAKVAVEYADALIAELEKSNDN